MGLLARFLESQGISSVTLSSMPKPTARVRPPRTLLARMPRGQTAGPPGDPSTQAAIVRQALELLATVREPGAVVPFDPTRKAGDLP